MKTLLVKHNFLVCALWLFACCTATASKEFRTMWISTAGKNSPQCIHDTPVSVHGPVPLTRQPCRSLSYALSNIQNGAINTIFITCGVHVLEPFESLDAAPPLNATTIVIEGTCAAPHNVSLIQCTDGANVAFYNVKEVVIEDLTFQDCGEQLQPSESLSNSSTLYFQDCKTVVVQYSLITITGPYGSGISFVTNDPTITPRKVHIDFADIKHYGIHGTGIHFEVRTTMTKDIDLARVNFELTNTNILHLDFNPSYNITMRFTGINITVMGDGEGGEIILSNVNVRRTPRGNGISIAMLDRVCGFNVQLTDITVIYIDFDPVILKDSNNTTVILIPCDEHLSATSKNAAINSTPYFGIKIEVRGNSTGNRIQVRTFHVEECSDIPGSAFLIEITDTSEENVVQLSSVGGIGGYERGLQVIVTGWAKRNEVQVDSVSCLEHRALWGAGGYFEFSGHAQGNLVNLTNSKFEQNDALRGGGIAVACRDFATQNTFKVLGLVASNNSAELGGGVYAILQDSSMSNTIHLTDFRLYNNTANCGGGMFIRFQDTTAANRIEVIDCVYWKNTLLPSEIHAMMGGGAHVEFSTVSATFRTDNSVKWIKGGLLANTAGQGIGGGISVLYKHSLHQGESGDIVHVDGASILLNKAASGSACAFQSVPTHGKRLFRGVIVTNTYSLVHVNTLQTLAIDNWFEVCDYVYITRYINDLIEQSYAVLREETLKTINPSFQVDTNTNAVLTKSVQLTVDRLIIVCGI